MTKLLRFVLGIALLYFFALFIRAEFEERKAEKRIVEILTEVASPWDASLMRKNGSEWLLNRAPLSPEKISGLATNDLGSLREIVKDPECSFQSGYERGNSEKRIWAICNVTGRFEKKTAILKIRLIVEPSLPSSFFGHIGDSLKLNDFIDIGLNGPSSN